MLIRNPFSSGHVYRQEIRVFRLILNIYDLTKMETAEFRGSAERESCLIFLVDGSRNISLLSMKEINSDRFQDLQQNSNLKQKLVILYK